MGRSGIRRRKPKANTANERSPRLSVGDQRRLFGQFTWGGFSPAGTVERHGFFWRQVPRNGVTPGWRVAVVALLWILAVGLTAGTFVVAVLLIVGVLR